jgi:hypothetical protein
VCASGRPLGAISTAVWSSPRVPHAHAAALHDRVEPRSHTDSYTAAGKGWGNPHLAWAYPTGVEPYPSRLAAPPVCPRLQDVQGNPSAIRCQRCVRPRPCATLPLSSSLAWLLPIEDTAQPDTPAAVSKPRRVSPCGAKGSCGVPGRKRPHEPCNTPYLANSLPVPRASSA